ncbi:MAG: photosystem II reaction center protein Psb28 [Spirulinaceae cyanobacterium RM2_2_10]|nr:photosystem II reaction center protein Psb28 [Spirulinaceae cyanobacterium RM2_2_10]
MTARIEFSRGVAEETVPDVRVTRSKDGNGGTATFYFADPQVLSSESTEEITGMYLVDEEGEVATREVKGKFVNGQARAIEAILVMRSADEWERFLRFMDRYAEANGLGFNKA